MDKPLRVNAMDTCPTCGSRGEVHTSDDGTSYYVPIVAPEPDEIERLRMALTHISSAPRVASKDVVDKCIKTAEDALDGR